MLATDQTVIGINSLALSGQLRQRERELLTGNREKFPTQTLHSCSTWEDTKGELFSRFIDGETDN